MAYLFNNNKIYIIYSKILLILMAHKFTSILSPQPHEVI